MTRLRKNEKGMILAIDMGNTNIVIGCVDDNGVLFEERLSTDFSKTELEYAIGFKTVLELYNIDSYDIKGAIMSSVVPQLSNIIKSAVEKTIGISPLIVGPGIKTGLNILMDQPRQVGSDQIVILPGIRVSVDSLVSRTAQLPRIALDAPKSVMGKNTIDCMKSGVVYGNASCIDGMIDRMIDANGFNKNGTKAVTIVATGGLSEVIIPHCRHDIKVDPGLLLKGLSIIYDKNVE